MALGLIKPKARRLYSMKRKEALAENLALTLRERSDDPPLRYLALADWGDLDILQAEFDALRRIVLENEVPKFQTTLGELMTRTCHLLFALVESGGLCSPHPERLIERLRIDIGATLGGYVRLPARENRATAHSMEGEKTDDEEKSQSTLGPRQHLYALGHDHLLAFVYYRIRKHGATDGDRLLPVLPQSIHELRNSSLSDLPWIKGFTGRITWRRIIRFWLNRQVSAIRGEESKVSWENVRTLALWRLLSRERRPLLVAARQNLFTTSPLPEAKINDLLTYSQVQYRKTGRKPEEKLKASMDDEIETISTTDELTTITDFAADEEVMPSETELGFATVRRFLHSLLDDNITRAFVVEEAGKLINSTALVYTANDDLRRLLSWTQVLLSGKRLALRTIHDYGNRVLRVLYELAPRSFAELNTDDVADYLDNTCESPNTVRTVRNTLREFDAYLIKNRFTEDGHVIWSDRSLLAYEQYHGRDVLTENEYQAVRRVVIESSSLPDELKLRRLSLLTLLRRCGLRSSEASWLTADNVLGLTERRLHVLRSKTRAGRRRMLPLYLLLDDEEMDQLCQFIQMRREQGGERAFLFADDEGERTRSANIGREIEILLREGGVRGETAHGLRHALASALFAAWWLERTSEDRVSGAQAEHSEVGESWARRALRLHCRPGIDARAVNHAYHIQLLLGHADLRVTFDRYIHLVDLAVADAVWRFEHGQCEDDRERMKLSAAARLAGMDIKQLRSSIPENKRTSSEVTLMRLNDVLSGRLLRFVERDR